MSRFHSTVFVFLLTTSLFAKDPVDIIILYDDATGNIQVETNLVDTLHSMRFISQSGIFSDELVGGVYDQRAHLIEFPLGKWIGSNKDLGMFAPPGLSYEFLNNDLCVDVDSSAVLNSLTLMGRAQPVTNQKCSVPPDPNRPVGEGEKTVVFRYDNSNGNLFVDIGDNSRVTALEITSPQSIFTGDPVQGLGSIFDVDTDHKIFKALHSGFEDLDFGNVVAKGLSNNEFLNSVCVQGAWLGGGGVEAEYQIPAAGRVPIPHPKDRTCGGGASLPTDIHVEYNPDVGYFTVSVDDLVDPDTKSEKAEFSVLQITSESGIFAGTPENLNGVNDLFSSHAIIKQDLDGFSELAIGAIIKPGVSLEFLLSDLSFDAVLTDNSSMGKVTIVPEPAGVLSVLFGLLGIIHGRHMARWRYA